MDGIPIIRMDKAVYLKDEELVASIKEDSKTNKNGIPIRKKETCKNGLKIILSDEEDDKKVKGDNEKSKKHYGGGKGGGTQKIRQCYVRCKRLPIKLVKYSQ